MKDLESRVFAGWSRALLLSLVFGFVVRFVPELFSSYPIGYDTIWYAWRVRSGIVWYHWSQVFSTWLLYGILVLVYSALQVNMFSMLKVVAALLFGFDACGMFYFATKGLGWSVKKGVLVAVFFSLQIAALFVSANFYRNMLGLGILLFALPLLKDGLRSKRQFLAFALLSILVVLSHEAASVILFGAILGFLVARFIGRRTLNLRRRLIAVIPAFVLFVVPFFFLTFPPMYQMEKNRIAFVEPSGKYPGALFYFTNYLWARETVEQYTTYFDLVSQIFSFFGVLYLLMLPLVLIGFFRDIVLDSWTALFLIGSFGVVVVPVFAPSFWWRWMLMLVFPFTLYSVNGIAKIFQMSNRNIGLGVNWARRVNLRKAAAALALIISIVLGLVYAVPTMRAQVSIVPLDDSADTVKTMGWIDSQMNDHSVLLIHHDFQMWSRWCLGEGYARIYFMDDIDGALSLAMQKGFSEVYFVWWKEQSLYTLSVPQGFSCAFSSGRICVLRYFR